MTADISLSESIEIQPLEPYHDRGAFCCGIETITNFFRFNSRKDHNAYKVRVFVATEKGSKTALGFYSLSLKTYLPDEMGGEADKFQRVGTVPAIYLAMIGVTKELQGKGVGTKLIIDAFERTLLIAQHVGTYALALNAVTEDLIKYYENLGFEVFDDEKRSMFIPLSDIRAAVT